MPRPAEPRPATLFGMERFLWVCLAGAAGTGVRYAISVWAVQRSSGVFPYGTLIVNIAGCFLIAAILQTAAMASWSPTVRTALAAGFVGGLTTYSSFNFETTRLLQDGETGTAFFNLSLTVLGGYAAGWLGLLAARRLFG